MMATTVAVFRLKLFRVLLLTKVWRMVRIGFGFMLEVIAARLLQVVRFMIVRFSCGILIVANPNLEKITEQ